MPIMAAATSVETPTNVIVSLDGNTEFGKLTPNLQRNLISFIGQHPTAALYKVNQIKWVDRFQSTHVLTSLRRCYSDTSASAMIAN